MIFSVFSIAFTPPPPVPACTARCRVEACASSPSTSMRKWTSPPSAAHSRSSVGSSESVTSAAGARSTISRVPLPTTSSSLTTWKTTSPRGSRPCSSTVFVAHSAAASPPFMSVAPRP